jgi:spermidine synthase
MTTPPSPALFWLCDTAAHALVAGRKIVHTHSQHQRIELWDTPALGRVLLLDARPMTASGDEFIYHECMTHPAALAHPAPRRALILGGGDGGAARELLKHASLHSIVIAELDAAVVALARQCLPTVHQGALDDPRVSLVIGDAGEFVAQQAQDPAAERYDLVVFDLTPPDDSPASHLFAAQFFKQLKTILQPGALVSLHLGAPFFQAARVQRLVRELRGMFRHVAISTAAIPLYGGPWAMAVASDDCDVAAVTPAVLAPRAAARELGALRYYSAQLHGALFTLPGYIRDLLQP